MMYFPCRHHIRELIFRAAFEGTFPVTTGPNVPIFRRFKDAWKDLDKSAYKPGFDNAILQNHLELQKKNIYNFTCEMLKNTKLRGDYKENF